MAECDICREEYDNESRIPLRLSCCVRPKYCCLICIEARINSTANCFYCTKRWSIRSYVNNCKEKTSVNLLSELNKTALINTEEVVERKYELGSGHLRKDWEDALQENMRKAGVKSAEQIEDDRIIADKCMKEIEREEEERIFVMKERERQDALLAFNWNNNGGSISSSSTYVRAGSSSNVEAEPVVATDKSCSRNHAGCSSDIYEQGNMHNNQPTESTCDAAVILSSISNEVNAPSSSAKVAVDAVSVSSSSSRAVNEEVLVDESENIIQEAKVVSGTPVADVLISGTASPPIVGEKAELPVGEEEDKTGREQMDSVEAVKEVVEEVVEKAAADRNIGENEASEGVAVENKIVYEENNEVGNKIDNGEEARSINKDVEVSDNGIQGDIENGTAVDVPIAIEASEEKGIEVQASIAAPSSSKESEVQAAPSSSKKSDAKRKLLSFQNSDSKTNGDGPWCSEKLMENKKKKKESPSEVSTSTLPPSFIGGGVDSSSSSSPTPKHKSLPVPAVSVSSSSSRESTSVSTSTLPHGNIIKPNKNKRFIDKNGTIHPKKGDEIRVLYDEKDWYAGFVHDFDSDKQIVTVTFEEGETETREFPDEDILVLFADLGTTQRNGGRPMNPKVSKNDVTMKSLKKDLSDIIGLQYAEMYFVSKVLCEYWCTVIDLKVIKGKEICTCQWSDGSKTKVPLKKVIIAINLCRANERKGKNGASVLTTESNQHKGTNIKSPSSSSKENSGPSKQSEIPSTKELKNGIEDNNDDLKESCSVEKSPNIYKNSENDENHRRPEDEETDSASENDLAEACYREEILKSNNLEDQIKAVEVLNLSGTEIADVVCIKDKKSESNGNKNKRSNLNKKSASKEETSLSSLLVVVDSDLNVNDISENHNTAEGINPEDVDINTASGVKLADSSIINTDSNGVKLSDSFIMDIDSGINFNSKEASKDQDRAEEPYPEEESAEFRIIDKDSNNTHESPDKTKAKETSSSAKEPSSAKENSSEEGKDSASGTDIVDIVCVKDKKSEGNGNKNLKKRSNLNKKSESKVKGIYTEGEGASGLKLAGSSIIEDQNKVETYAEEEGYMDCAAGIAEIVGVQDNQATDVPLKDLKVIDGSIGSGLIDDLTKTDSGEEVSAPLVPQICNEIVLISTDSERVEKGLRAGGPVSNRPSTFASTVISSNGGQSQNEFLISRIQQLERDKLISSMPDHDEGNEVDEIGHLSQRESFLIARIQKLELDKLVFRMPPHDVMSGDDGPDRKQRRK